MKQATEVAPIQGKTLPMRSWIDDKTDAGASALYGALMGLESCEFEGDMAMTGMTVDKALSRFLEDVAANGGPQAASLYATRLIAGLQRFVIR